MVEKRNSYNCVLRAAILAKGGGHVTKNKQTEYWIEKSEASDSGMKIYFLSLTPEDDGSVSLASLYEAIKEASDTSPELFDENEAPIFRL